MRNFKTRIKKSESKYKNPRKLYKFYLVEGTFFEVNTLKPNRDKIGYPIYPGSPKPLL